MSLCISKLAMVVICGGNPGADTFLVGIVAEGSWQVNIQKRYLNVMNLQTAKMKIEGF